MAPLALIRGGGATSNEVGTFCPLWLRHIELICHNLGVPWHSRHPWLRQAFGVWVHAGKELRLLRGSSPLS